MIENNTSQIPTGKQTSSKNKTGLKGIFNLLQGLIC